MSAPRTIRDVVTVRPQPTVVRLQDLEGPGSGWISERFFVTDELGRHLRDLRAAFERGHGTGGFVIGQFGSGKSHLLAYLAQQIAAGEIGPEGARVVPVSLVDFASDRRLEDIVGAAAGVSDGLHSRRDTWAALLAGEPGGLVLLIDELSEFLRSKPGREALYEDVRFLQFLGELAADQPLWTLAAVQEQIEHTGLLERAQYRKIKDRFPLRLSLSPTHVFELISRCILVRKPGYDESVATWIARISAALPKGTVDRGALLACYPMHPATLELLEEVRDRFGQARGAVDFTVARLGGDPTRGIEPFLDRPFGEVLTPDHLVLHFSSLFEMQPEFVPVSQLLMPSFRRSGAELFEKPKARELAERLLNLLVLVYLSPARESLKASEAASWLLLGLSRVDPERSVAFAERTLSTLADRGRYVVRRGAGYALDFRDDGTEGLEHAVRRELDELGPEPEPLFELIAPLLSAEGFSPFVLPREQWQLRKVRWLFHERDAAVYLGCERPPGRTTGPCLCVRLPWGPAEAAPDAFTVLPTPMSLGDELRELAAMVRLRERSLAPEVSRRLEQRVAERATRFEAEIKTAYAQARFVDPRGLVLDAPRIDTSRPFGHAIERYLERVFERTWPGFQRYAPSYGPLPADALRAFMRAALDSEITEASTDELFQLVREAYLLPMGLMRREGRRYAVAGRLEQHELVKRLRAVLDAHPQPKLVYAHLAEPVYGLVPDQVHVLLLFLLALGDVDILKGRRSYRESFEMLPSPLSYDRIVPGRTLSPEHTRALDIFCRGLRIATPERWTVLSQRQAIARLAGEGRRQADALRSLALRLEELGQAGELSRRVERIAARWRVLSEPGDELETFEQLVGAVGDARRFLGETLEAAALPDNIERQVRELERLRFLLSHEALELDGLAEATAELRGLELPPPLDAQDDLELWLRRATDLHARYKERYKELHDAWWARRPPAADTDWSPPAAASSRHLALSECLAALRDAQLARRRGRCRGLSGLEFQPVCTCGFDGGGAPYGRADEEVSRLRRAVEHELRVFFDQAEVRRSVRSFREDGLDTSGGCSAYLAGEAPWPEPAELGAFDDHLAGVSLVQSLPGDVLREVAGDRIWERGALLEALDDHLRGLGDVRLRVLAEGGRRGIPGGLLDWCAGQVLEHGAPLPGGLSRDELRRIGEAVHPDRIAASALESLDELGLDEETQLQILRWIIGGELHVPPEILPSPSVRAAVELLRPSSPRTPQELATLAAGLYRSHPLLVRTVGGRWLERLDVLASSDMVSELPPLEQALRPHARAQWVLMDCLGLPLLEALSAALPAWLPEWEIGAAGFAVASESTTTDACHRELIEAGLARRLEKVAVIDELIHGREVPFADLEGLALAELRGALERLRRSLDPAEPALLFADHGFRMKPDGRGYAHGGSSTLERVVPLIPLATRRDQGGLY